MSLSKPTLLLNISFLKKKVVDGMKQINFETNLL